MRIVTWMTGLGAQLGVLRVMLVALVLGVIAISPFTGGPARFDGWAMVNTVVGPVLFVMMVFTVPLDITMSLIFMSDKTGEARDRFVRIIRLEIGLLVVMLVTWAPFVAELLGRR